MKPSAHPVPGSATVPVALAGVPPASPPTNISPLRLRAGQRAFMRLVEERRLAALLARRQYGKTYLFAAIALKKMMRRKNHTVIFGSAKLTLAREIVRKEAAVLQGAIATLRAEKLSRLQLADRDKGPLPATLAADDFAEVFEAQRLEFRYYHDNSSYSRTKVVALTPDTVGETGDLMCDELRSIRNWREVWEAINPIIAADPTFRCTLCTTVPADDTHFAFEMLCPPAGTQFPVNPAGNIYKSEWGLTCLRLDAYDAEADAVKMYDDETGAPITAAAHRAATPDKDAWDRNFGLRFIVGGTAACDLLKLSVAQERGIGKCRFWKIESDADFNAFLVWLAAHLHPTARVGLGFDVATTTKKLSNPSALGIVEESAGDITVRADVVWKTGDPDLCEERLGQVIDVIARRPGGRARGMAIDATNERLHAVRMRKTFRAKLPVTLIVASENVDGKTEGTDSPVNWKEYSGTLYVGVLNDNKLTLPPERYVKEDHRLVTKEKGKFTCEPDDQGRHGDTFDCNKLGLLVVKGLRGEPRAIAIKLGNPQLCQST